MRRACCIVARKYDFILLSADALLTLTAFVAGMTRTCFNTVHTSDIKVLATSRAVLCLLLLS